MSTTPLLSLLKKGTFVTFSSSSEDMNNVFTNDTTNRKFVFSKFTLLNLPEIKPNGFDGKNVISCKNIEGAYVNGLNVVTPQHEANKLDISESFQNYALNMESSLMSAKEYDRSTALNCSERIFFKWLKELGVMRYTTTDKKIQSITESRFTENDTDKNYSQVVKYIGEVDMQGVNAISNENVFNETYLNIPSQCGATPTVMFRSVEDKNYNKDTIVKNATNTEFIRGRDQADNPTSAGLSVEALYDMDVQSGSIRYNTNGIDDVIWFDNKVASGPNAYFTDSVFSDSSDDIIVRNRLDGTDQMTYIRSRLDGVCIDFDVKNYKDVELYNSKNDDTVITFNQYNQLDLSQSNFDFNVICLYYDIYDKNNPENKVTNLYGVLFLNDIISTGTFTSKIKTISKIKQDNFISQQGNGFGVKLNFKFDVSTNLVDRKVEVSVNDYNTFSMSMFVEAMNNVVAMSRSYEKLLLMNKKILDENIFLREVITNSDVSQLRSLYESTVSGEKDDILFSLSNLSQKISEILSGKTTVNIDYLLNVESYGGIKTDLSGETLKIENVKQMYANQSIVNFDVSVSNKDIISSNIIKLKKLDNLVIHKNNGIEKISDNILVIRIDDKDVKWSKNQSMKIIFSDKINFLKNNFGIMIYTDSEDKFKYGKRYSKLIGIVDKLKNNNPVIELICVDDEKLEFAITNF